MEIERNKMTKKMQITYKPTIDLIPYARNSRTHSDVQIGQIAASIREFGFRVPVLVDQQDGIIAGHGRVLAALRLGLEEVPTVYGGDMTEVQRKMYVIADNKLALNAGWDEEMLSLEIGELKDLGAELDILGFDPSELVGKEIDYSVLDGDEVDDQLDDMAAGVRKAIQIEFEPQHYDEAQALVKFWRDKKQYVGMMLINYLKNEKDKL